MFVLSVKTSYKQLLSVLACVAVLAVAAVVSAVTPTNVGVVAVGSDTIRVSDTTERLSYLRSCGYEAAAEEVREVRLPDEPDEALTQYETVQLEVGRSLVPYYGKRVRLYTYTITNADPSEPATAHIYVYRNKIIAADVTVNTANGTVKPLTLP